MMTVDTDSQLWETPKLRRALAAGDWAAVLEAATAAGVSQTQIAQRTGLSQPHVSRLVRGRTQNPSLETVRALCDGLGIPRHLAGLIDKAIDEESSTDRRQFIGTAAIAAAGVVLTDSDEALLMAPITAYRRLERTTPSRLLTAPVTAHLGMLRRMAAVDAPRRLWAAISETAGLAAWLFSDCEDRGAVRDHYRLAIESARQSGHPLLPAYMLGSFAQFATWSGDTSQGLSLIQRARAELSRAAPPIALAWLDTIEAITRGFAGEQAAMGLTDRAAARLTAAEPIWPWLFSFDTAKIASYRALVAMRLRRPDCAHEALAQAANLTQAPKQYAITTMERANMLAEIGQIEEGSLLAGRACEVGRHFSSERVTRAALSFRAGLPKSAAGLAVVRDLDARLAAIYYEDRS